MTNNDLHTKRRYTLVEAAAHLNVPHSWLRRAVVRPGFPHQRRGARGVWFTWNDITKIGEDLPGYMSLRRADAGTGQESAKQTVTPMEEQSADPQRLHDLAEALPSFRSLRA